MLRIGLLTPGLLLSMLIFAVAALWRFGVVPLGKGSVADAIVAAIFGAALLGLIAAAWSDLVRSPFVAWRIGRRIRRHPESVLPTTARRRQAELVARDEEESVPVVPRRELYDEVLPGLLDRERRDVQMIVGDAGAGKTTALVELASLLAKVGVVPIVVEMRGAERIDVEASARERLRRHAGPLVGSSAHLEALWRWLRERRRLVVFVDDIDRVAPNGERGLVLRRTLEKVAAEDLPTVVTARPAGLPAGLAATAINLDRLDEHEAVEHVLRVARREPGFVQDPSREAKVRGDIAQWVREGGFAEVPFYLELLARLVAAGKCPELAPAGAVRRDIAPGRIRQKADGRCDWNPLWVRFYLLEHFHQEVEAGQVHRWLGIGDRERESCLNALSEAALATLAATALRARARAQGGDASDEHIMVLAKADGEHGGRDGRRLRRWKLEQFLDADDRRRFDAGERTTVSTHEVVDTGERLRILDRDPTGALHFRHRIMQAYLASRCLVRSPATPVTRVDDGWVTSEPFDWIGALLDSHHPERLTAHMTLTFAALDAARDESEHEPSDLPTVIVERLIGEATGALAPRADAGDRADSHRLDPREPFDPEEPRTDPDDALAKLKTAAEIARATGHAGDMAARILGEFAEPDAEKRWDKVYAGATRWAKAYAIPSIAALEGNERWYRLWRFARDPDHAVRRAVSEAIENDAFAAYRTLEAKIRDLIVRGALTSKHGYPLDTPTTHVPPRASDGAPGAEVSGDSYYKPDWRDEDVARLRALGWVLPAIVSGLREHPMKPPANRSNARAAVTGGGETDVALGCPSPASEKEYRELLNSATLALEQLSTLAFQREHHGLEASLAQGFKRDAVHHASDPERPSGPGLVSENRRLVTDLCLDNSGSWYARLTLHQALALYTIAGSSQRVAFDVYGRLLHREREPHPFVRHTAHLARRAVARHVIGSRRWDSLIWADEAAVAARRPTQLDRTAVQLVGDITLMLNLKDRARNDRRSQVRHMSTLPHCLSQSRDRLEILGAGCPASCHYDLCPLTAAPVDEPSAQRSVSRAFCRAERQIARRHKPRWQRHMTKRALRKFWWEMERRART
jgi:hypothetical protein